MDINTGRIREARYVFCLPIKKVVKDSILTKTLGPLVQNNPPDWKHVNEFSFIRNVSPHFKYHGAISDIKQIEITWDMYAFSEEARLKMAQTILELWRTDGDDSRSGYYINDVALIARDANSLVLISDLPEPQQKK
ncbi:MAG: hypothetical protein JW749_05070 [Sedimentisphaerales bacterium]|nr:hypothetical protein [Sedimentisphaerales bacterium]